MATESDVPGLVAQFEAGEIDIKELTNEVYGSFGAYQMDSDLRQLGVSESTVSAVSTEYERQLEGQHECAMERFYGG